MGWTTDETEAEVELHMPEIEDECLTLPKWTRTFPTTLTYRIAHFHAEMSHLHRETDIRHVILCLLQGNRFHPPVKSILLPESRVIFQETLHPLNGAITLHPDEKMTIGEMRHLTTEPDMTMGEETLEDMIDDEAEVQGVGTGIGHR